MSVNGKPFKPDPTSYMMTGIPCGNPLRYRSRGVIRTTRDDAIPFEDQQMGIPGKGTLSLAEMELKNLLKKQLDVEQQTIEARKVGFTAGSKLEGDISSATIGVLPLYQFLNIEEAQKRKRELLEYGFDDGAVSQRLKHEGYIESVNKRRRVMSAHPDHINKQLKEMEKKIHSHESKVTEQSQIDQNYAAPISRHALELESSILRCKSQDIPLAYLYGAKFEKKREDNDDLTESTEDEQMDNKNETDTQVQTLEIKKKK